MALDPAAIAPQEAGPKFKMISKSLSVSQGDDGKRRFHLTASSTIEDRVGDEIEVGALHEVAAKFREGVTIFMDHDWKHVESAFGVSDSAEVVQKGLDPESGKPIWDLDVSGPVNVPNPRAVQLADSIDGGYVKLGASMTAFVRRHARKPGGRGMLIKSLDLVEASVVGVAENQRSWAHKAALAIKSFYKDGIDTSDLIEEETMSDEVIEKGMEAPETDPVNAEPVEGASDDNEKTDDGLAPVPANTSTEADGQASTEASGTASETPAEETPETASDDGAAEPEATPTVEKSYDPADVAELVRQTARLAQHVERLDALVIQKDATINELTTKVAKYEADARTVATEVDDAAAVIEKALALPLRPRAQAIVDDAARNDLFANYPGISDYLNKRRHLTNG